MPADPTDHSSTPSDFRKHETISHAPDPGRGPIRGDSPPSAIGPYKILETLGEGGMGIVYLAEQDKPRRVVALKVIKPGYASPQHLKRFEQESQVLGRLQHPGIAQIFEAGVHTFDQSRDRKGAVPYFAMEFIRGRGLKVFMDENNLGTRLRLELVAKVCDAVHHAHQKGVIHRDLKPSNILVDESGQPKILDFGVARATDSDIQATTIHTDVGQIIGTIPYMSPEQVAADPQELDTRSDVYALGVIAYEALSGQLPYNIKHKMIHEAARVIREEEPAPLSTINRVFRGDVETIVAKSLEKDKSRRYQSAAELASDIRRYLHDEPIIARPASAAYQFKKFAKRHKAVVVGVAAVFLVLTAGFIVSTTLYFRAENARAETTQERDRAVAAEQDAHTRRAQAEAVTGFLRNMLTSIQPALAKGREISVREVLDEASKTVHERFKDEPLVEVSVQQTIGDTYTTLGLYKSAIPHWGAAREILNQTYGADHVETIVATFRLGITHHFAGNSEEALEFLQGALSAARRSLGEENQLTARVMDRVGAELRGQGRLEEAEPLLAKAMDVRERLNVGDLERAESMIQLGLLYMERGRYKEAEERYRRALEIGRRERSNEDIITIRTIEELAEICARQGKWDEAELLSREAAETGRRVLGVGPYVTRKAMTIHSRALEMLGRYAEAESVRRELLENQRHILESGDPGILISLLHLSRLALAQDARERAMEYWEEQRRCHAALMESTSFPHPMVKDLYEVESDYVFIMLVSPLCEQRDAEAILPLAERSVEQTGAKDPAILGTLALAYWMTGKRVEAIATQTKAIDLLPPGESNLRTELEGRQLSFRQESQNAETSINDRSQTPN